MQTFPLISLFLFCALALPHEAHAGTPADTAQALEDIRTKYRLPAIAVAVARSGKICDRAAVGVRKSGDPTLVSTNDLFHIGSCTKAMTATLAAMLIEEGKLRWDTTIAEVFPELKGKMHTQYEGITLEQLLTHRGGTPGEPPKLAWIKAWTEDGKPTQQRYEFIQAVLRKAPQAPAGSKFIYSNQGYAIAGAMLEKTTGTPWETLMTNRIFRPLNMASGGFGPPGTIGKVDQPWGHTRILSRNNPSQSDNPPAIAPAGRVHCSLDDLARFAMFHLEEPKDGGLLKPGTLRKLHIAPEGGDYACGWGCGENPQAGKVLTHAGSNSMWYVFVWLAPEKNLAIVVGMNIGGESAEKAAVDAARAMIKKWLP